METSETHQPETGQPMAENQPLGKKSLVQIIAQLPNNWWHMVKKKPLLGVASILIAIVLLLIIIIAVVPKRARIPTLPEPSPTAEQTPSPQPQEVSEMAKTEEFVLLEQRLNQLTDDIDTLDLLESRLTIPVLDVGLVPVEQ